MGMVSLIYVSANISDSKCSTVHPPPPYIAQGVRCFHNGSFNKVVFVYIGFGLVTANRLLGLL